MAKFHDWFRYLLRDNRGSTAVAFAVSMPLVVAGASLGGETSYWYYKKLQLQGAADAAAYAGAIEKRAGSNRDTVTQAATKVAVGNGFNAAVGSTLLNSPPQSGTHINGKAVEVVLEENAPRFF